MLSGLNHITLAVSELDRSFDFYVALLGLRPHAKWNKGCYLTLGSLWFCLSVDDVNPARDYTHVAFSIDEQDFAGMKHKLIEAGVYIFKENKSEGASIYFLDPDGHKLEVHAGDLESRLAVLKSRPYAGLEWFDA